MRAEIDWEDYLGEEVVDRRGDTVGRLECYWTDDEDDQSPAFLGISTEEDRNRTFVVPAAVAKLEERYSCVRLSVPGIKVRQAPQLNCDQELDAKFEQKLTEYFNLGQPDHEHHFHIHRP
jgi:hypothetical protein